MHPHIECSITLEGRSSHRTISILLIPGREKLLMVMGVLCTLGVLGEMCVLVIFYSEVNVYLT